MNGQCRHSLVKGLLLLAVSLSSVAGYAAPPLPPPPQNAALLYYQVFLILKLPDGDNNATWALMREYAEGKIALNATIRDAVDHLAIPKRYAIKASELDLCDWGSDFSEGVDMILPYLGPLRRVAWLLQVDARSSAERGDFAAAADRCLAAYRVARHADKGLTLICFLVANAMDNVTHECLRTVLTRMPKDGPTLDRIQNELRQVQTGRVSPATVFEYDLQAVWQGLTLKKWLDPGMGYRTDKLEKRIRAHAGTADEREFIAKNRATMERYLKRQLAVLGSERSYAEKFAAIGALNDRLRREGENSDEASLAASMLVSYSRIPTLAVRNQAAFNALETAIDLYRIQLSTGRLPDALPGDTPKDPFSGKPFLYEKKSDGDFTLRCQGMDLIKKEVMTFEF